MEEPQHPDTDEPSLQDETDSRYVLSQIPTRKSYGIKQGVPLQYEYVKVSKGGADQTQEGWEKPSRKVRTRRGKANKSSLGVRHDENFYGALASDGDDSDSEPAEAESSVAEQAAGSERMTTAGFKQSKILRTASLRSLKASLLKRMNARDWRLLVGLRLPKVLAIGSKALGTRTSGIRWTLQKQSGVAHSKRRRRTGKKFLRDSKREHLSLSQTPPNRTAMTMEKETSG